MARMSIFERWLVKSPFRAWLQRGEIRAFLRWADLSPEACMLDMGCGTGVSSALILDALRPRCLAAFDFDSSMVGVARPSPPTAPPPGGGRRHPYTLQRRPVRRRLRVRRRSPHPGLAGRCARRRSRAGSGGRFCFVEPSRRRLRRGLYRMLPHSVESMFDVEEWRSALAEAGLQVEGPLRRLPLWDICGLAMKQA